MDKPETLAPQPFAAAPDEVEALLGALHRNRRTFAWKTGGLDAEAMRRTFGPSTMTLGGLVKHMALVEDHYFTHQLLGRDYPDLWAPVTDDDAWEWTSASADSPEHLRSLWLEAVARSQPGPRGRGRSRPGDRPAHAACTGEAKPLPPPKPLARPLLLGLGGSFDDQQVLAPEAEGVAYVAARLGRPSSDDPKYMCGPENKDDLGRQVRWIS